MNDRLYRSRDDRMLAGVAGGLAELWDADPSLIRIVWALLVVFTGGIALLVYIVMAIVVPEEEDVWPATATPPPAPAATEAPSASTVEGGPTPDAGTAGDALALTGTSAVASAGPGPASPPAPGALWAPSPAESRRQARREARAARRAAGGTGSRIGVPGTVIGGAFLVLLGVYFLAQEFLPQFDFDAFWPLVLVGIGVLLLVYALGSGRDQGGPA